MCSLNTMQLKSLCMCDLFCFVGGGEEGGLVLFL